MRAGFVAASQPTQVLVVVGLLAVTAFVGVTAPAPDEQQPRVATVDAGPSSDDDPTPPDETEDGTPHDEEQEAETLYPDRQDRRPNDEERLPGDPAAIDGIEATVLGVAPHSSGRISVAVQMRNTGDAAQRISTHDGKIQTSPGQVLDSAFRNRVMEGELLSAELLPDGTAEGIVIFTVGEQTETFYVLWQSGSARSPRGVWGIEFS